MIERVDQHQAFARQAAEIAFLRAQRRETQHRAMLFDTRQQFFQKGAALQPGLPGRQRPRPARIEDQGSAAEVAADFREIDEMFDGVVAGFGVVENAEFGTAAEQRMQPDDLQSRQLRHPPRGLDLPDGKSLPEMGTRPAMVGGDFKALDAEGAKVGQVGEIVESRQHEVGDSELHRLNPVLQRRR